MLLFLPASATNHCCRIDCWFHLLSSTNQSARIHETRSSEGQRYERLSFQELTSAHLGPWHASSRMQVLIQNLTYTTGYDLYRITCTRVCITAWSASIISLGKDQHISPVYLIRLAQRNTIGHLHANIAVTSLSELHTGSLEGASVPAPQHCPYQALTSPRYGPSLWSGILKTLSETMSHEDRHLSLCGFTLPPQNSSLMKTELSFQRHSHVLGLPLIYLSY